MGSLELGANQAPKRRCILLAFFWSRNQINKDIQRKPCETAMRRTHDDIAQRMPPERSRRVVVMFVG
jgi:hypothetical protein